MITAREFQEAVGRRLRQLREAMEKTQDELGEKLHVKGTAISNYEKGTRALDPYSAYQLKFAYGAPLEWLYGGDESVIPPALAGKLAKAATAKRRPKRGPSAGAQPKTRKTAQTA